MKITKIETLWFEPQSREQWEASKARTRQAMPNNLFVRVHTDKGLIGLGETY